MGGGARLAYILIFLLFDIESEGAAEYFFLSPSQVSVLWNSAFLIKGKSAVSPFVFFLESLFGIWIYSKDSPCIIWFSPFISLRSFCSDMPWIKANLHKRYGVVYGFLLPYRHLGGFWWVGGMFYASYHISFLFLFYPRSPLYGWAIYNPTIVISDSKGTFYLCE